MATPALHAVRPVNASGWAPPLPDAPGFDHLVVETPGLRAHLATVGEGDPVLMLHGFPQHWWQWRAVAPVLAARGYRVLCPDVAGRGDSDWIDGDDYSYPQYCADMVNLIARSGAEQVDWIGTSMGGIIGMILAAQAQTPIRRMVLNDVGPFIPKAALDGIAETVAATFLPSTTLATARRSSMRPFVQEPMKTRSILMSVIFVPGFSPI